MTNATDDGGSVFDFILDEDVRDWKNEQIAAIEELETPFPELVEEAVKPKMIAEAWMTAIRLQNAKAEADST